MLFADEMESELCRHCSHVARWMHHQGRSCRSRRVIRAGLIDVDLQSVFLGDITAAYEKTADLESLLFDDFFNKGEWSDGRKYNKERAGLTEEKFVAVHKAQPGWRRVIAQAVLWGVPTPAFSTALAFFDGYRSEIVPANIIQAQVRRAHRARLRSEPKLNWSVPCSAITLVPIRSRSYRARRTTN